MDPFQQTEAKFASISGQLALIGKKV